MPSKPHVYVSERQLKYGRYVRDGNNERKFQNYTHTRLKTSDGQPVPMVHVMLPSQDKREKIHGDKAHSFGLDKNGIDLDTRRAYIQVPAAKVYDVSKGAKDSKGRSKMKVIYIDDKDARFNVYFEGQKTPDGRFDRPEKANIGVKELQHVFPSTRDEVKKLRTQKTQDKDGPQKAQSKERKAPAQEQKKAPQTQKRDSGISL